MTTRRLLAAGALIAAALTLTACGPDETPAATPAATSAAPSTAAPSVKPTTPARPTPSGKPSASAKPAPADCTAKAQRPGHRIVQATDDGYVTHIWMKAQDTKFVCGPDVPDDGYFEAYGDVKAYTFANDAKAYLLASARPQAVSLDDLMKHADACLKNRAAVAQPYACYGNQYDITVDSSNVITSITELYHP